MYLIEDKDGKKCAAKTVFIATAAICLIKVLLGGVSFGELSFPPADYAGMAALIGAVGAIYFGRNHTKAQVSKNAHKD